MSRAAKATRRAVLGQALENSARSAIALQAIAQVGGEWRVFTQLGFFGRLRWLMTGHLGPTLAVPMPEPEPDDDPAATDEQE